MHKHQLAIAIAACLLTSSCGDPAARKAINLAKSDITERARDPDSVAFRHPIYTANENGEFVCIEVNMANAMGGKTGFKRHVWSSTRGSIAWDGRTGADMGVFAVAERRYMDRYCAR